MNIWLLATNINDLNEGKKDYWSAAKEIERLLDRGILDYTDENVRSIVRVCHAIEERNIPIKNPYLTAVHKKFADFSVPTEKIVENGLKCEILALKQIISLLGLLNPRICLSRHLILSNFSF